MHGAILGVTQSTIGPLYSDSSIAVTRDLGNGHSENDLRPEFRKHATPMRWFGTTEARVPPEYVAAMRARHGEAAEKILIEGAPHVMIFPNLFIAEIQVFNLQPVSVGGECVQYSTAVQLVGAPELNKRLVSQCLASVGPAGMLLADDTEMYERNQAGLEVRDPEWLDVRRAESRAGRRARIHHRHQHRRDRYAGVLVALQAADGTGLTMTASTLDELHTVPTGFDRDEVEQFLYREARFADESDYDSWEALWTDDALYWVPANGSADARPGNQMAIICDNRSRIGTRLKQIRTGKRYAQTPVSNMRRLLSNIELLGGRTNSEGGIDLEVGANFLLLESRARGGTHLWGVAEPPTGYAEPTPACDWSTRRLSWWTTTGRCPPSAS